MRNLILTVAVVGALLGLAAVQYHFLRIAIQLEKVRFDKEARQALQAVVEQVEHDPVLGQQLSLLQGLRTGAPANPANDRALALADTVTRLIDNTLAAEGLSLNYAFAIKEGLLLYPVVSGPGFRPEEEEAYRTYVQLLQGQLRKDCNCDLFFYLQANNLLPLLMQRLIRLVLPSAAFLLLLLVALLFLIRMLHQLKKLDEVKNDFINNLTHELKTPAFSISLLAKLLRQALGAGDRKRSEEYLGLLEGENEQLKGHIDKVLELASLEAGHPQLKFQELELHPMLETTVRQYRHKAESQGGELNFRPQAGRSRLMADERYLSTAVRNLLDNALLYGGETPRITVSTLNQGKHILLSVADNGPGIALRDQRSIFRKFHRLSGGDIHNTKGFGLGLSFTREIARTHGGTVSVKSEVGKGSVFTIVLPVIHS